MPDDIEQSNPSQEKERELSEIELAPYGCLRELVQREADGEPVVTDTASIIDLLEWKLGENGEKLVLNAGHRNKIEDTLDELENGGLIEQYMYSGKREWATTQKGDTAWERAQRGIERDGRALN